MGGLLIPPVVNREKWGAGGTLERGGPSPRGPHITPIKKLKPTENLTAKTQLILASGSDRVLGGTDGLGGGGGLGALAPTQHTLEASSSGFALNPLHPSFAPSSALTSPKLAWARASREPHPAPRLPPARPLKLRITVHRSGWILFFNSLKSRS